MQMKQKFLSLIILGLVVVLPVSVVFAEDTNVTKVETESVREQAKKEMERIREQAKTEAENVREQAKQEMERVREQAKTEFEYTREKLKDSRGEIKKEIASKRVNQTLKVYTEAANRLDKIVVRIEARIAKIKAAGGDTTAIQTSLDLGKTKLAEARAGIAAFAAIDVSSATSTSTAQTLFNTVKIAAAKAKEALKVAHSSFVKTITLIQGAEKIVKENEDEDDDKNASTTTNKN